MENQEQATLCESANRRRFEARNFGVLAAMLFMWLAVQNWVLPALGFPNCGDGACFMSAGWSRPASNIGEAGTAWGASHVERNVDGDFAARADGTHRDRVTD
jgi:hypothetical protein